MITPLIPPGIAMILYGCIANVSIGKLFMSGITVGLTLCLAMMVLVHFISIKRGYVPHPVSKKYSERHLARILLIAELRECMAIDRVGAMLAYVNGDADDESDDIITEERLYDVF